MTQSTAVTNQGRRPPIPNADQNLKQSWWNQGACVSDPKFVPTPTKRKDLAHALEVCARCPVSLECFLDAILEDDGGIRGGTTYEQRRELVRVR